MHLLIKSIFISVFIKDIKKKIITLTQDCLNYEQPGTDVAKESNRPVYYRFLTIRIAFKYDCATTSTTSTNYLILYLYLIHRETFSLKLNLKSTPLCNLKHICCMCMLDDTT